MSAKNGLMKLQKLINSSITLSSRRRLSRTGRFKPARSLSKDPFLSFRFKVMIDGFDAAGFNEVTGLTFETAVESFREGGFNAHEHQLAGPTKCPEKLILKRGLSSQKLWDWYKDIMAGKIVRKNHMTITLLDLAGEPSKEWQWVFINICPVKWTGPQFLAGTAEVAFESIELIHKGLKVS